MTRCGRRGRVERRRYFVGFSADDQVGDHDWICVGNEPTAYFGVGRRTTGRVPRMGSRSRTSNVTTVRGPRASGEERGSSFR